MLKNTETKEVAHSQDAEVTNSMQTDSLKITLLSVSTPLALCITTIRLSTVQFKHTKFYFPSFHISILVWVKSGICSRVQQLYNVLCKAVLWQTSQHSSGFSALYGLWHLWFFYLRNSNNVHLLFYLNTQRVLSRGKGAVVWLFLSTYTLPVL